jgi:hypothetical protein
LEQTRGRLANESCSSKFNFDSDLLKVVVPHIDINGISWGGTLAPQFTGGKTDRINVLALIAEEMRTRVGEAVHTMIADDCSGLAAGVAR